MTPKQVAKAKAKANEIQGAVLRQWFTPCCVCRQAVKRPRIICDRCSGSGASPHRAMSWGRNPRGMLISYGYEGWDG